jgi:hypothetical protein
MTAYTGEWRESYKEVLQFFSLFFLFSTLKSFLLCSLSVLGQLGTEVN